ncbi:MAG: hypothetical protein M0C28_32960 [Candidatus Moduliflexus flocculans]|nr:hypothetical protein [Candidatus Moduliflexus flocculans]
MKLVDRPAEAQASARVTVFGAAGLEQPARSSGDIGFCPEHDALLRGHDRPRVRHRPAGRLLRLRRRRGGGPGRTRPWTSVELTKDSQDRLIRGYSRGMRQRLQVRPGHRPRPGDRSSSTSRCSGARPAGASASSSS